MSSKLIRSSIAAALIIFALGISGIFLNRKSTTVITPKTTTAVDFFGHVHRIIWNLALSADRTSNISRTTSVSVIIDGKTYDAGTYNGTCQEIGSPGTALLVGDEMSAVRCWSTSGGNEVGVFTEGNRLVLEGRVLPKDAPSDFPGPFEQLIDLSTVVPPPSLRGT